MDGVFNQHYLDTGEKLFARPISEKFPDESAYIVDLSIDERRAIVKTSSSENAGVFYVLNFEEWRTTRFGTATPWLSEYRMGKSRTIESVSSDGLRIESYLTSPTTLNIEKPPLIVMPHGGPVSVRDNRHFNSFVQILATLGYAVLQPNYRGSAGFGKAFQNLGMQQWGRLIEDDIESALHAVVDAGLVDGDKVCIYGSSYGGYSALYSAVRSPHLYRCAASFAGVTDLSLLFNRSEVEQSPRLRSLLEEIVGDPDVELQTLVRYSPAYNAGEIGIPVFLSHGAKDSRVDIEHYWRMKKMLEFYGKDVEYLLLNDEGHGFRYVKSVVVFHGRLDAFFRKHLDLPLPDPDSILTAYGPAASSQ